MPIEEIKPIEDIYGSCRINKTMTKLRQEQQITMVEKEIKIWPMGQTNQSRQLEDTEEVKRQLHQQLAFIA